MLNKLRNKKAFTLIELIVVMAIIGILVLLAIPKFMGHTKEAKFTKLVSNSKQLENASERYYMNNQDWPRLSDTPYTAGQITAYAQKIYDTTGKEATLDLSGEYYDIDYSKLSQYIQVPDSKMDYIIQNPVGNVYALENLTKEAEIRTQGSPFVTATFTNAGKTGRDGPSQIALDTAYLNTSLQDKVVSENGIQVYTVPKSGKFKIEVYGSSGGLGSSGAVLSGVVNLTAQTKLRILVGQAGEGTRYNTVSGGGGTFVVKEDNTSLITTKEGIKITPLIIAGGGGGLNTTTSPYSNGQTTTTGGAGYDTLGNVLGLPGGTNGSQGTYSYLTENGFRILATGGAGLLENSYLPNDMLGMSFINGGLGGTFSSEYAGIGGFGGGGAGIYSTMGYPSTRYFGTAGGGGGYSGGGTTYSVSYNQYSRTVSGGGGGSFIASNFSSVSTSDGKYNNSTRFNSTAISNLNLYNGGNGKVIISFVD